MTSAQQEEARKLVIAQIEKEAEAQTHLVPRVVVLYQGARYQLYLYKRYTDIRLVMAPEEVVAFFGGDKENFEYPRYDLDMCFFRVYENDKPLQVKNYLKWSASGPKVDEVLFVAGNPGSTDRIFTSSHLEFLKEVSLPLFLKWVRERKGALAAFSKKSEEHQRIAQQLIFGLDNTYKVLNGTYKGLTEQSIIAKKKIYEKELYGNPEDFEPWVKLKNTLDRAKGYYPSYLVLEAGGLSVSKLYLWAKNLVRVAEEKGKPTEIRLKEYADTELPALELSLFSTEPVYLSLERENLIIGLQRMVEVLGKDHPAVKIALTGKSPQKRADELLKTTHLQDLAYRKELYSDPEKIKTSTDPLIRLALALDPFGREIRKVEENDLESVEKESYAAIANLIFKKYGETIYPDATFTLRLSMGEMKGYEQDGALIEPMTTIGQAYLYAQKHEGEKAYQMPLSWKKKQRLLKNVPFNFVLTNDIVGGNSGSPVINAQAELVGLIFDGNVQSLTWSYEFDEVQGRAIAVHSEAMIETLEKIYGASALVREIKN
jgi:hypothetical protein